MAAFRDELIVGLLSLSFFSSLLISTVHLKAFVQQSFIAKKLKMSSNLPGWMNAEERSLVNGVF